MRDYKATLNMPSTGFEMKADLKNKELKIQQRWESDQLYQKILAANKGNRIWTLHDGPPYANGDLHLGHALNKTLKDIIVRHRLLLGDYSLYIPGWDTHGLPIEHAMLKRDASAGSLSVAEFRSKCMDFAKANIQSQMAQFKRFGLATDFKRIYYTYDQRFESDQLKIFYKLVAEGIVYRDLKPVYWSPSSRSALAEAELEYADMDTPSIYVGLEVVSGKRIIPKGSRLLIWTTTP